MDGEPTSTKIQFIEPVHALGVYCVPLGLGLFYDIKVDGGVSAAKDAAAISL